jgi:O-antigen/teichoic acid export membrane protein
MSIKKKLIKFTFIFSIGTILSRFFIFLFRAIIARELSVEEYGKLALLMQIFSTIIIIANFQINPTVNYLLSKTKSKIKERSNLIFHAFLSILPTTIIAIILFYLILYYTGFTLNYFYLLFIFAIIFQPIRFINAGTLRFLEKIKTLASINASVGVFRFFILFILFYLIGIKTYQSVIISFIISLIIPAIVSIITIIDYWKNIEFKVVINEFKKIYSYSFYMVISMLSQSLTILIPSIILSRINFNQVAYFDMGFMMFSIFTMIFLNISLDTSSLVSKYIKNKKRPLIVNKNYIIASIIFYCFLLVIFISQIDKFFVNLILGDKYIPAIQIFYILIICLPFYLYNMIMKGIFMGLNKVKKLALIEVLFLLLLILLVYIFLSYAGIGVAIAFILVVLLKSLLFRYINI